MLTTSKLEKLKPRAARYTTAAGRHLGLEIMPSGRRAWRVRAGKSRLTIGYYPRMSLKAAQQWVKKWEWLIVLEGIPGLRRMTSPLVKQKLTVREFGKRYVEEVVEKERKNPKQLIAALRNQVYPRLGNRPIGSVAGAEVRELIFRKRDAGRPAAAASLRNLIKRLYDYAIVCGVAEVNPASAVPLKFVARSKTRERTLSRRELGQFVSTLYQSGALSWRHVQALMLILLTMCRKSELLAATWAEFDLQAATWEIPAEHSKTGKPHIVYLSSQACAIMRRLKDMQWSRLMRERPEEYVFHAQGSTTQPMSPNTLNRALGRVKWPMRHFTIHDLRRTGATLLSEEGFAPDVIEKALNHTIKGVRGVYNRAEYSTQRKEMLQAWADLIDKWKVQP